jgi:RND superfamily putative drug exporter
MGPLAGKFEDVQENDPADYLPANAESVQAINVLEEFPSGDIANAITVFQRDGGLTVEDKVQIASVRGSIDADAREGVGETSPPIYS